VKVADVVIEMMVLQVLKDRPDFTAIECLAHLLIPGVGAFSLSGITCLGSWRQLLAGMLPVHNLGTDGE
jgi:hypothetical protein